MDQALKSRVPGPDEAQDSAPMFDLIELFFFAYRDFVSDADRLLEDIGFGRAHHRVLHFVGRRPGITVGELLGILAITKQSLARVLTPLVDEGYVLQAPGRTDRRQRLLFPTDAGRQLAGDLALLQARRINRALSELGPEARAVTKDFLLAMINPEDRDVVAG